MSEVKITPLARRLAEENGIDWRQLAGTGPDGTVVERDILAFLAKVMAGEVNLPPAVEDAAPPPEAIPDFSTAQAALQREGVQLGDLMPTAPAAPSAPVAAAPAPAPTSDFDDDFELDIDLDLDEPEPVMAAEAEEPVASAPEPVWQPAEAALPNLEWDEPEPLPGPAAAQVPVGLAGLDASVSAPLGGSPNPELDRLPALPDDEPEPTLPSVNLPPLSLDAPAPAAPQGAPKLVWETQEVLPAPEPLEPVQPPPLAAGMTFGNAPEPLSPEPAFSEPEPVLEPEPAPLAPLASMAPPPPPLAAMPDLGMQAAAPAPAPMPEPEPTPPPPPLEAPAAPVAAVATAAAPQSTGRMLHVQSWQRLVEVGAATDAAKVLAEAWSREMGLYPMLYRAVDRALSDTHTPVQAAKGVLEGDELKSYSVTPAQTLKGALDSLESAHQPHQPGEGLTVLSLADTAFDQVIFPGQNLLTLGRSNSGHALLSLSGAMSAQEAGALLERVAYYLERPILLA